MPSIFKGIGSLTGEKFKPKLLAAIAGLLIREEYFFSCRLKKETPAVAVKKVRKLRREILIFSEIKSKLVLRP
jgi:hypothetical protein